MTQQNLSPAMTSGLRAAHKAITAYGPCWPPVAKGTLDALERRGLLVKTVLVAGDHECPQFEMTDKGCEVVAGLINP